MHISFHEDNVLTLHDVLFVPDIRRNILSILVTMRLDFSWFFNDNYARLIRGDTLLGFGHVLDNLIVMDVSSNNNSSFSFISSSNANVNDVNIWHARLYHIG